MADVKHDENEPALPSKRKPDLASVEIVVDDAKKQKLKASEIPEEKIDEDEAEAEVAAEEDDDDEEDDGEEVEFEDEDDDDEDEDEDDDGGEHSNGKAVVDRKGKGIMKEDKGKGKLIEKDDSDDDDDSSDGDGELDGDSDLSDDSLAEVDLDNILPSRTRRRVVNPGVYLANDIRRANNVNDSDDSDDA